MVSVPSLEVSVLSLEDGNQSTGARRVLMLMGNERRDAVKVRKDGEILFVEVRKGYWLLGSCA